MGVYWIMFILPFLGYLHNGRASFDLKLVINLFFIVIFSVLIGFRFEVGGDWSSYNFYYQRALNTPFLCSTYLRLHSYCYCSFLTCRRAINWLENKDWFILWINVLLKSSPSREMLSQLKSYTVIENILKRLVGLHIVPFELML